MKSGNRFIVWSKAMAYRRQKQLAYSCWTILSICLLILGIVIANYLNFSTTYVIWPSLIIVFIIGFFSNRKLFFQPLQIIGQQEKCLRRWKIEYENSKEIEESRKGIILDEINSALMEMAYMRMCWK